MSAIPPEYTAWLDQIRKADRRERTSAMAALLSSADLRQALHEDGAERETIATLLDDDAVMVRMYAASYLVKWPVDGLADTLAEMLPDALACCPDQVAKEPQQWLPVLEHYERIGLNPISLFYVPLVSVLLQALAASGEARALELVRSCFRAASQSWLRCACVAAFGKGREPALVAELLALRDHPDRALREEVALALEEHGRPESLILVEELLAETARDHFDRGVMEEWALRLRGRFGWLVSDPDEWDDPDLH